MVVKLGQCRVVLFSLFFSSTWKQWSQHAEEYALCIRNWFACICCIRIAADLLLSSPCWYLRDLCATIWGPRFSESRSEGRVMMQAGQLAPIDLLVETRFHRAAPGGMGGTKAAGNYSPVSAYTNVSTPNPQDKKDCTIASALIGRCRRSWLWLYLCRSWRLN